MDFSEASTRSATAATAADQRLQIISRLSDAEGLGVVAVVLKAQMHMLQRTQTGVFTGQGQAVGSEPAVFPQERIGELARLFGAVGHWQVQLEELLAAILCDPLVFDDGFQRGGLPQRGRAGVGRGDRVKGVFKAGKRVVLPRLRDQNVIIGNCGRGGGGAADNRIPIGSPSDIFQTGELTAPLDGETRTRLLSFPMLGALGTLRLCAEVSALLI